MENDKPSQECVEYARLLQDCLDRADRRTLALSEQCVVKDAELEAMRKELAEVRVYVSRANDKMGIPSDNSYRLVGKIESLLARATQAESELEAMRKERDEQRKDRSDAYTQRDEALAKWHGHQKNVPCAGCEGGHDTYWGTVVKSDQWISWEKAQDGWDVDECRECGHISQEHFQAFLAFVISAPKPSTEAGL
jgi:hypothetical protein